MINTTNPAEGIAEAPMDTVAEANLQNEWKKIEETLLKYGVVKLQKIVNADSMPYKIYTNIHK